MRRPLLRPRYENCKFPTDLHLFCLQPEYLTLTPTAPLAPTAFTGTKPSSRRFVLWLPGPAASTSRGRFIFLRGWRPGVVRTVDRGEGVQHLPLVASRPNQDRTARNDRAGRGAARLVTGGEVGYLMTTWPEEVHRAFARLVLRK